MELLLTAVQIALALSVAFVWILRYDNVIKEFKQFGLSDVIRNTVGASKIALATLLIAGILYPSLAQIDAILLGLFMIVAQYYHFKINNPFMKHLPSLILLILCIFIALGTAQ